MTSVDSKERRKEEYCFRYGDEAISYEVVRKDFLEGKKRKIAVKVHPNCEVIVIAPSDAQDHEIHEAVIKRGRWVCDALTEFRAHHEHVQHKQYVSGEMLFYLGRRYVLKVVEDPHGLTQVKMVRGKLLVSLRRFDKAKRRLVKSLVQSWYLKRAEHIFTERLKALLPRATWVTEMPSFRVVAMQKQWGSCSVKGSLMLNPHLVKAPKDCIDYVILHELCHIAEHNHSDRFWRLLTHSMPNWKEVKTKLDGMAELYLNE